MLSDRTLNARLKRVGITWPVSGHIIKAVKRLEAFGELAKRNAYLKTLPAAHEPVVHELESQGYAPYDKDAFGDITPLVDLCKRIAARSRQSEDREKTPNNLDILSERTERDPSADQGLLDFVFSPAVISTIAAYLGEFPVVGAIYLWRSVANDLLTGSQQFHFDKADFRQAKMFVNITDIAEDGGPFTFIPMPESQRLRKVLRRPYKRVSDAAIKENKGIESVVRLTGPAGTAALVDTCRCLHCGSRTRVGERVVLMIQYLPYTRIMEPNEVIREKILSCFDVDLAAIERDNIRAAFLS